MVAKLNLQPGMKFNDLTIVSESGKTRFGKYLYKCKCTCGNEVTVIGSRLISGLTKSCGCYQKKRASEVQFVDLTGKTYGKLLVLKCVDKTDSRHIKYECICDCGKTTVVIGDHLVTGHTTSCGCYMVFKVTGVNSPLYGKPPKHGKGAWFKGVWLRSSYEVAFAKMAENMKINWVAEPRAYPVTYEFEGKIYNGTYTPDFEFTDMGIIFELKGYWRGDAKVKYEAFRAQYPELKVKLLMKEDLKRMGII